MKSVVREICTPRSVGLWAPQGAPCTRRLLERSGGSTHPGHELEDRLRICFVHLLRNALDHGLETSDECEASGKPLAGQLSIRGLVQGDQLILEVEDDGRGLAFDRLEQLARSKGETYAQHMTIARLVFKDGVTTAASVSDISGRGVGMASVRYALMEVGGSIDFVWRDKRSTATGYRASACRLHLPLRIFSADFADIMTWSITG